MQIIPAILPKNQTELNRLARSVIGATQMIQVDVCDGKFVPSKTQFSDLPHIESMDHELDLMIESPEDDIESWIDLQPARMVIHVESVKNMQKLFEALDKVRGIIEIGFSISNDTPNEVLETYMDDVDFIQLMGISKIGSQGQPFDSRVLEKISYFHEKYPDMPISVDGAVSEETIAKLRSAGASRFVAGSAVFGTGDAKENIEKLAALVE